MCPEFLAILDSQPPPTPPTEFHHHVPRVPGQPRTSFVIPTDSDSSSDAGRAVRWRLNPNPVDALGALGFNYNDNAALNAALALPSSAAAASSYTTADSYFVDEPDPEPEPEGP